MNNKAIIAVAAVAAPLLCWVYYNFDPAQTMGFPRCPSLLLTGLKCPGCGSQRALHQLLHGEIVGAMRYNFLAVALLPAIALSSAEPVLRKWTPWVTKITTSPAYSKAILAVVCLWCVLRNIFDC